MQIPITRSNKKEATLHWTHTINPNVSISYFICVALAQTICYRFISLASIIIVFKQKIIWTNFYSLLFFRL